MHLDGKRWMAALLSVAGSWFAVTSAAAAAPELIDVTVSEGTSMAVAVSPDGRQLVIDLQGSLWTLPASGGKAQRITDVFNDAHQPVWSPDGSQIAFVSERSGVSEIYVMDADGANVHNISNSPTVVSIFPRWSAGNQIMYTVNGHPTLSDPFDNQAIGIASVLIQSTLLMGVILTLVNRWRLPFGALTFILTANTLLMALFHDHFIYVAFALAAGLVADVLLLRLDTRRAGGFYSFAFLVPFVVYGLYFLAVQITEGVGWTLHLWLGTIFIAGIAGLLVSLVIVLAGRNLSAST